MCVQLTGRGYYCAKKSSMQISTVLLILPRLECSLNPITN